MADRPEETPATEGGAGQPARPEGSDDPGGDEFRRARHASDRELQSKLGALTSSELHCAWFQLFTGGRVLTLANTRFGDPSSVARSSFFLSLSFDRDKLRWYRADSELSIRDADALATRLRDIASDFTSEFGISTWNGFALARFCGADAARLRTEVAAVLRAVDAAVLPRIWMN